MRKFASDNIVQALQTARGKTKAEREANAVKAITWAYEVLNANWPAKQRDSSGTTVNPYTLLSPTEKTNFDYLWSLKSTKKGGKQDAARQFRQTDMTRETAEKLRAAYLRYLTTTEFPCHLCKFINQGMCDDFAPVLEREKIQVQHDDTALEIAALKKLPATPELTAQIERLEQKLRV